MVLKVAGLYPELSFRWEEVFEQHQHVRGHHGHVGSKQVAAVNITEACAHRVVHKQDARWLDLEMHISYIFNKCGKFLFKDNMQQRWSNKDEDLCSTRGNSKINEWARPSLTQLVFRGSRFLFRGPISSKFPKPVPDPPGPPWNSEDKQRLRLMRLMFSWGSWKFNKTCSNQNQQTK